MKTQTKYTFICCECGEEKEGYIEDDMEDGAVVYISGGEVKAMLDGMEIVRKKTSCGGDTTKQPIKRRILIKWK
jgi:hypothetical protein